MRVGLAIDALSPQLTGIGRYVWELCLGLNGHPDMEEILFYRYGRWFPDPSWFLQSPKPPKGPLLPFLSRMIAGGRFRDLLFHSPNYFLPPRCERGIVTVHDLSVFRFPDMHPPERVRQFELGLRRSLDRAEHIITDSEFIRAELSAFAGLPCARISAIPLGVAGHFFKRRSAAERASTLARHGLAGDDYCLCVATLEPRKGLDLAIQAFTRHVQRTNAPLILVIIGAAGWNNRKLHEHIANGIKAGHIKLLGYVTEDDLPDIYAASRLFLYPSLYEGFGLPPLEAMASGTPALVSNRSCLPEVTQGAAKLVDPLDIHAFSIAIDEAINDVTWRTKAIETGLEIANGYSWQACVSKTIDVYRNCGG